MLDEFMPNDPEQVQQYFFDGKRDDDDKFNMSEIVRRLAYVHSSCSEEILNSEQEEQTNKFEGMRLKEIREKVKETQ